MGLLLLLQYNKYCLCLLTKGEQRSSGRFTEGLNLTPEQQSKVDAILKASEQEIREIREKSKPGEARSKIQDLIKQKIMGILTAEQKKKLSESTPPPQREQRRPVRGWVLSEGKKPVPVSVFLGITNGSFSEEVSGDIKEGAEVIIEEAGAGKGQNQSTPSPFGRDGMRK